MKKIRLMLVVVGLLLTIISSGQTSLTFRLVNPGIVLYEGASFLSFDIEVKASAPGTYLFTGGASLDFNGSVLSSLDADWSATPKGALLSGSFPSGPGATKEKYTMFNKKVVGLSFNLAWGANSDLTRKAPNSTYFNEVKDFWQPVATVSAKISDANAGMVEINFNSSMDGQQFYQIVPGDPEGIYQEKYGDEPPSGDLNNLYAGRIYANSNWTQIGGTLNWGVDLNTSVWDGSATVTHTGIALAKNLRVHGPGELTIPSTGQLTVSGNTDIIPAGGLIIASGAEGTGSLIAGPVTGTAVAQRYMTGKLLGIVEPWHLISSPVSGQSIETFVTTSSIVESGTGNKGLASYDNSVPAWDYYVSGDAGEFVTGKGYSILRWEDASVEFKGTPATSNASIAVTNAGPGKWWNLIGNPYPSSLYATNAESVDGSFLKANSGILEGAHVALYVWNPDKLPTADYDVLNYASGETYVAPGQGFFIRTTGGTANFTTAMRAHTTAAFKSGQKPWTSVNVKASIAGTSRSAVIYYIPGTTAGIDAGYDAGMFEESPAKGVYTAIEGSTVGFAIQSLPDTDYEKRVVAVGLNAPQGSTVNFTADVTNLPAGTKVYLEDRLAGSFTRLDESGATYSVSLGSASHGTGRFYLHTKQGVTGLDVQPLANLKIIALPQDQIIRVLGTLESATLATLYDMNGKMLVSTTLYNPSENEISFRPLSSGIYMLKLQTGTTIKAEKINWVY